jgi:DNA-binding transcriptional regulator YiaG
MAKPNFKTTIRQTSEAVGGLAELSRILGIPYRTLQDWECGKRKTPGYVIHLLEREMAKIRDSVSRGEKYKP